MLRMFDSSSGEDAVSVPPSKHCFELIRLKRNLIFMSIDFIQTDQARCTGNIYCQFIGHRALSGGHPGS